MAQEQSEETKADTVWMEASGGVVVEGPNGGGWFKITKGDQEFNEHGEEDSRAKAEELRKSADTAWMEDSSGVIVAGANEGGWFKVTKGNEEFNEQGEENAKTKAEALRKSNEKSEEDKPKSDPKPRTAEKTAQPAMSDMTDRTKAAKDKGNEFLSDAGSFARDNVQAVVEFSQIFAQGMQDMSREAISEGRSEFETFTDEVRELAAVKSPTDFFQLQSAMMRRYFDRAIATGTKNSQAMIKLAYEAAQPMTNRVSTAAGKVRAA